MTFPALSGIIITQSNSIPLPALQQPFQFDSQQSALSGGELAKLGTDRLSITTTVPLRRQQGMSTLVPKAKERPITAKTPLDL
jgi:hypothetical protein